MKLSQLYEVYPAQRRVTLPLGLRVDGAIFGRLSGVDPVTGLPEADASGQLRQALSSLRELLLRGGARPDEIERLVLYAPDEERAAVLAKQAGAAVTPPVRGVESRAARLPDGVEVMLDVVARAGGAAAEVQPPGEETIEAVRLGPLLFVPGLTAPATGDTGTQVKATFEQLETVLAAAGASQDGLLRIAGYFRDLGEKDLLNDAMVRAFPEAGQRPVHKYVPSALPPGVDFLLQAIGLDGAPRQVVEMEGMRHRDPISLGALAGNVFVSSRVQGALEAGPSQQTQRLLEHARRLVEHAGGGVGDITQTAWGIGDPVYGPVVEEECARYFGGKAPRVDVVEAAFPHSPLPRLEFFALLT